MSNWLLSLSFCILINHLGPPVGPIFIRSSAVILIYTLKMGITYLKIIGCSSNTVPTILLYMRFNYLLSSYCMLYVVVILVLSYFAYHYF
jgi:hypothetical protein